MTMRMAILYLTARLSAFFSGILLLGILSQKFSAFDWGVFVVFVLSVFYSYALHMGLPDTVDPRGPKGSKE